MRGIFALVMIAKDRKITGAIIRTRRRLLEISQETLASQIGIWPSVLSAIERGVRQPTPELIERIEKALAETASR